MNKKIVFIVTFTFVTLFSFVGCMKSNEESVSSVAPSEKVIQSENSNGGEMQIYVDKETGVEYLIFRRGKQDVVICPRYNSDGTLYIHPDYRNK